MSRDWKIKRHAGYPRPEVTNPRPACHASKRRLAISRLSSGWVLLLYLIVITTATHWPGQFQAGPPVLGIRRDYFIHAVAFMPLLWLIEGFLKARPGDSFWRQNRLGLAAGLALAWAAMDEFTQQFVGRDTTLADWIGDATGVALAVGLVLVLRAMPWRQRRVET